MPKKPAKPAAVEQSRVVRLRESTYIRLRDHLAEKFGWNVHVVEHLSDIVEEYLRREAAGKKKEK